MRLTNFELLRIVAMLMVVTMHYLWYGGSLPSLTDSVNSIGYFALAVESLAIVAVNLFVIVSGYFLVNIRFKLSRLLRLMAQVLFYSLLIPLLLFLIGIPILADSEGIYGVLAYVLPVSTQHYWFITSYVLLILLSPLLNSAFLYYEKKELGVTIILLIAVFSGIKSFVPVMLNFDNFGYDFGWFICLYLCGAYIRTYDLPWLRKKNRAALLYLLCTALIFGLKVGSHFIHSKTGQLKFFYDVPFHYNFILVFAAAVALFYVFKEHDFKINISSAIINRVAPLCLGVYLIHMHYDIRDNWFSWSRIWPLSWRQGGVFGFALDMVLTVILVFVICIAIDYIRLLLFTTVEKAWAKVRGKKEQR
jgi:surface polysaccharide O-acyltransferase-like enzyme